MGKHNRHIRQRSPGTAALCAGLLGMALLCSPLASAAGRFGMEQDGIVDTAAAGVGMQGVTPMALRDVRGSGLPQLHDANTLAEKNRSVPFSSDASELGDLVQQARTDLGLQEREFDMFSLDMPNMPPSPAIVIAANAEAQKARPTERVLGICLPTAYVAPGSEPNVLAGAMIGNPSSSAAYYLSVHEKLEVKDLPPVTSFELVKAPLHTKLVLSKNAADEDAMYFVADPGYVGSDYAELRVNVEGRIVKLAYYIHVTKADLNSRDGLPQFCPKEPYWKISMSKSSLADWQRRGRRGQV